MGVKFDASAIVVSGTSASIFIYIIRKSTAAVIIFVAVAFVCIDYDFVFHYIILYIKKHRPNCQGSVYVIIARPNLNIFNFNNFKRLEAGWGLKFGNIADFLADKGFGQRR